MIYLTYIINSCLHFADAAKNVKEIWRHNIKKIFLICFIKNKNFKYN